LVVVASKQSLGPLLLYHFGLGIDSVSRLFSLLRQARPGKPNATARICGRCLPKDRLGKKTARSYLPDALATMILLFGEDWEGLDSGEEAVAELLTGPVVRAAPKRCQKRLPKASRAQPGLFSRQQEQPLFPRDKPPAATPMRTPEIFATIVRTSSRRKNPPSPQTVTEFSGGKNRQSPASFTGSLRAEQTFLGP